MKRFAYIFGCLVWLIASQVYGAKTTWVINGIGYYLINLEAKTVGVINPDLPEAKEPGEGTYYFASSWYQVPTTLPVRYSGEINIPEQVTLDGEVTCKVVEIAPYCFFKQPVTKVNLPESIKTIYSSAFTGCTHLKEVKMPGVNLIAEHAFNGCTALTTVNLPSSLTNILEGAFEKCSSLEKVTIPQSVTIISRKAFADCKKAQIELHNQISVINDSAFAGNEKFTQLNLPAVIYCSGFEGCPNLKKVSFSSKLISVKGFHDCTALESFSRQASSNIYTNYYSIGDSAFMNCKSLRDYGDHLLCLNIGAHAFDHTALKEVVIAASAGIPNPEVGAHAFANCEKLEKVTCNMRITFDRDVFSGSDNIKEVWFKYFYYMSEGDAPRGDESCFPSNVYQNASLTVPDEKIEECKENAILRNFNCIQGESAIDNITLPTMQKSHSAEPCYDLSGRRLSKAPAKGLFLHGGKKFMAR